MSEAATTIHPAAQEFDPPVEGSQRRIGLLYGVTGLAVFLLMVLAGILMRLTQGDALAINDDWFYRLMTLHASGILVGVLMAMMGGLWYVMRSVVPQLDYKLALASWGIIVLGVVFALVSILIGGYAGAWTFLWPLPFETANAWSEWATVTYLLALVLVGVGFVIYCIDMLRAITNHYGGLAQALGYSWLFGRAKTPPPPQTIAAAATVILGIGASTVGMVILIALLDHAIDDSVTLDALWAKNLTYFFGHTLANLIIYLAAGMLYVLVPLYAGRQWKTSKPLVIGWMGTLVFVFTAYFHHLYMDFVQPGAFQAIGVISSSAAALPVAVVTVYTGMMLVWGSKYRWNLTSILFFLGFLGWVIGGAGAVIDSSIPINFKFHNTLWVPAHFHNYMLMGVGLWVLAMVSYLLERGSGSPVSKANAFLSTGALVVGGYGLVYVWYFTGALGVPRRWAEHPGGTEGWSLIGGIFAIIFLVGMLMLILEFLRMGRLAWKRRHEIAAAPAPIAGGSLPAVSEGAADDGFMSMIRTHRGLVITIAAGVAALFVFYPPLTEASENSIKLHHLVHAIQFLAGAMFGAAIGSATNVMRRFPGGAYAGLIIALIAPVIMLLLMIPMVYQDLVSNDLLHGAYHLVMIALGAITGIASAQLGRYAGWTVLLTSVGMALLFAPGVTGG
ncbi:MAG: cbb3-type cytochrome c oxidase subunit I [Solirubrobacterales bacterium]|nr:cbb3-type cytochrome c oxidase subunit I [Solirubrobacterales bacterium]